MHFLLYLLTKPDIIEVVKGINKTYHKILTKFTIEYIKLNGTGTGTGTGTVFNECQIVGTYEKDRKVQGFKIFDSEKKYRNVKYSGIVSIIAA